jgi:hypothetical protein
MPTMKTIVERHERRLRRIEQHLKLSVPQSPGAVETKPTSENSTAPADAADPAAASTKDQETVLEMVKQYQAQQEQLAVLRAENEAMRAQLASKAAPATPASDAAAEAEPEATAAAPEATPAPVDELAAVRTKKKPYTPPAVTESRDATAADLDAVRTAKDSPS